MSISVNEGDILGVVGSSGAGKSTLVRTIALLERPTSGRGLLHGAAPRRRVGTSVVLARMRRHAPPVTALIAPLKPPPTTTMRYG